MAAGVGPGDGTAITFAGLLYAPTSISFDGASVASVGTGGLGDTVRTYAAGNIIDWGTITVEFEYSGAITVPTMGGDAAALSFDVRGVGADGFATTAYIENFSFGIPEGDKMTGTMVLRLATALADD